MTKKKPAKKRKRFPPKDVFCILMPHKYWEAMVQTDRDGLAVGFRTLTMNGIRAVPCSFVEEICYVIEKDKYDKKTS